MPSDNRLDALEENFTLTMAAIDARLAELGANETTEELWRALSAFTRNFVDLSKLMLSMMRYCDQRNEMTSERIDILREQVEVLERAFGRRSA